MKRRGYKTTEFYLTLLAMVLGVVMASGFLGEGQAARIAGGILAALTALGYTRGRARIKLEETTWERWRETTTPPKGQEER